MCTSPGLEVHFLCSWDKTITLSFIVIILSWKKKISFFLMIRKTHGAHKSRRIKKYNSLPYKHTYFKINQLLFTDKCSNRPPYWLEFLSADALLASQHCDYGEPELHHHLLPGLQCPPFLISLYLSIKMNKILSK